MKGNLFIYEFEKYIGQFIEEHRLLSLAPPHGEISVAFSCGVDSVVLAEVLVSLGHRPHLIYINHGTRGVAHQEEELLVEAFAGRYQLSYSIHRLQLNLKLPNFEQVARKHRQEIFFNWAKMENGLVCTGHHLDDSFEWSMMQSLKQGDWQKSLGIPVKNGILRRPLLCVSKAQIQKYARAKKLFYLVDQSNFNTHFERNFFREKVISIFKERYPQYLKHYVARANALIKIKSEMKLYQANRFEEKYCFVRSPFGAKFVLGESHTIYNLRTELFDKFLTELHFYSQSDRGKLRGPLEKVFKKLIADEQLTKMGQSPFPFLGPWSFSGGVKLFVIKKTFFIMGKIHETDFLKLDQEIFEKATLAQIPFGESILEFPKIILLGPKSSNSPKESKYIHPLLRKTCLHLRQHKIPYSFLELN